jgi:hypothetical protein
VPPAAPAEPLMPPGLPVEDPLSVIVAAAAAATMIPMAAMPAMVEQAQQQQQQHGPAARWGRNLNPMTAYNVSVGNTWLPENKPLNNYQRQHFWESYSKARTYLGEEAPEEQLVKRTVKNWNATHLYLIQAELMPCGLDGMIRDSHVKKILRDQSYQVRAVQMGGYNPHVKPATVERKTLKKDGVAKLSHRDAAPWLKLINKPCHNMLAKRLEELNKYYDGKSDGHELSL